jgi:uncharacterized protein YgbK (DUF1537 family)
MSSTLPDGPLLAFYGDDFTGSTAVLEALAFEGLRTILFFEEPDAEMLAKAGPCRAVGLAGLSRSKSPEWMDAHLGQAFESLKCVGAPLVHYKICSTFDSSPEVGSIGKAIEIADAHFASEWVPVLTGAAKIARWQAFGQLFAGMGGEIYRIDRHPVMMRHPVTPMQEADLRLHLARQTKKAIGLIDLVDLKTGKSSEKIASECARGAEIILFDMVDDETLEQDGAILWNSRAHNPFVVGSQGVEYALIAHWRKQGLLPEHHDIPSLTREDRIAVVSGSCSSITAGQITQASESGFELIKADTTQALDPSAWEREMGQCLDQALKAYQQGRDPLIYTARGPDDPAVKALDETIRLHGLDREAISLRMGSGLGQILDRFILQTGIRRVVVSGGDSSGQACLAMGLQGVTAHAPLAPSAPLCRAISNKPHLDGLEIALKGGQMGPLDFFARARG